MKKVFAALLALMVAFAPAEARKVKGTVRGAGEPLSKVIVTDGVHFTTTDARGVYSLPLAKDAKFVHIVTPPGYTADYSTGTVEFYKPLTKARVYDFDLEKTADTKDFNLFSIADPQMKPQHLAQFTAEPLADLVAQAKKYAAKAPTVAIALGDFEGMGTLAKDIQEFRNEGAIVQIDGYVSNFGKGMSYNIVEKNEDGSQSVGTTFVIEGVDEDAYPADGTHVQLTGKVAHSDTKSFLIIRTLPEFVVVQE